MKRVLLLAATLTTLCALAWWAGRDPRVSDAALSPAAPERVDEPPLSDALTAEGDAPRRAVPAVDATGAPAAAAPAGTIVPADDEAELQVTVVSRAGRAALSGIRLRLSPVRPTPGIRWEQVAASRGRATDELLTDERGRASFVLPARAAYALYATGDADVERREVEIAALDAGEHREVLVELATEPDVRFFGRVVADEDGAPIAGARIDFVAPGGRAVETGGLRPIGELFVAEAAGKPYALTDADGRFELALRSWEERSARVAAPGRTPLWSDLPHAHATPGAALELRLRASASVAALIVDAGGAPLADVAVRLSASASELQRNRSAWYADGYLAWEERTDASGRCRIAAAPSGARLTLELVRDGKVARRGVEAFVLAPGEEKELELVLGGGAELRGRLVDEQDVPVARHEVWLVRADGVARDGFRPYETVGAKTRTDDEGRFVFADVAAGRWSVGPAAVHRQEGFAADDLAPVAVAVDVPEGAPALEVLVRTHRGLALRGRVVGPAGEAVGNAFVSASGTTLRLHANARTDERGGFALGPLLPGEYTLSASAPGSTELTGSERVVARAGDADVVLALRPGGELRVRVVDAETGAPVAGPVTVVVRRHGSDPIATVSTTLADGRFALQGQEPGIYALCARTQAGRCGVLEELVVAAGGPGAAGAEATLAVGPGATLRVRNAGKDSANYRVFAGEACVAVDSVGAGLSNDVSAPPGKLLVRVAGERNATLHEEAFEVAVDEVREVVLPAVK